jgi:hypothetical protein
MISNIEISNIDVAHRARREEPMPNYTYREGTTQVKGTDYRSLLVYDENHIECFKMLELKGGPPPQYPDQEIYGEDCRALTAFGAETIREVRRKLPYGPLNNTMANNAFAFSASSAKDARILAYSLNCSVETYWETIKSFKVDERGMEKQLWETAAYSAAALEMGGGVCAAISYVTMGVLTQRAYNIIACIYYNKRVDHSYVLIRRPETQWFVVDPWVRYPSVCPWKYNCFGADGGTHMFFYITNPTTEPFGVVIPENLKKKAMQAARALGPRVPFADRKIWGHDYNAQESVQMCYLPVCGPEEWGDKVAQNFDVRQLWL